MSLIAHLNPPPILIPPSDVKITFYKDTVGTDVFHSNDDEKSITQTTWTKQKEIKLHKTFDILKIYFELIGGYDDIGAVNYYGYARIYRNGEPIGTERQVLGITKWETFTEEISGWKDGDLLQLYARSENALYVGSVRNFRIIGTLEHYGVENTLT